MLKKEREQRQAIEMLCTDMLVPKEHLLRKIDAAVDFARIYELVEDLYCEDNGRPSSDPVVLFKLVLIQHLFGIRSLRQTMRDAEVNVAYRWFLGYTMSQNLPRFATISYAFRHRFTGEVIEELKAKYPVDFLCRIMGVNRSGYYKWRRRKGKLNRYEKDRIELTRLLRSAHKKHPSYGYHRLAYEVFEQTGWIFFHNLAHKCCKAAGICSKAESALISGRAKRAFCFPTESKAAGMPAPRFRSLSPT